MRVSSTFWFDIIRGVIGWERENQLYEILTNRYENFIFFEIRSVDILRETT